VRFESDRIERAGARPLRLVRAAAGTAPLGLDAGRRSAPAPLIAAPGPPDLRVSAVPARAEPGTVGEALAWAVEVEIGASPAVQDRLELTLGFGEAPEPDSAPRQASNGSLFGALAREVRCGGLVTAKSEPGEIARFAALAEEVAAALPGWLAPVPEVRPLPGSRRYAVDFSACPALVVSREAAEGESLPLWPSIEGFAAPAGEGASARFEPEEGAGAKRGLRLSFAGLRLPDDRRVQVHGRIIRNSTIADAVDPAFVYRGATVSQSCPAPRPDWRSPEPEPQAASLESALASLLGGIDGDSGRPYGLGLEAALVRRLEADDDEAPDVRIPLLMLPPVMIGGEDGADNGDLGRDIARALAAARAGTDPGSGYEALELAFTLSGEAPAGDPLARLSFRIPAAGDSWWATA
jgi:hypothetical protein